MVILFLQISSLALGKLVANSDKLKYGSLCEKVWQQNRQHELKIDLKIKAKVIGIQKVIHK